jgi:succinate dehydrogenase/fumarate reductase flavoprotein subunit
MKTKLTLSIDPEVIARAKEEAQRRGTSVSDMVETYLAVVSKPDEPPKAMEISPRVRALMGGIKVDPEKTGTYDPREEYREFLERKYVHD